MGGKGSKTEPWGLQYGQGDAASSLEPIMGMFGELMGQQSAALEALSRQSQQTALLASMPEVPDVYTSPEIDWTEASKTLANKTAGQEDILAKQKRGRMSTVLTSPLGDEDEVDTTQSLLDV